MELNLLAGLNSEHMEIQRDDERSQRGCLVYKMLYRGLDMGITVLRKGWNNHQEVQVGFEPQYKGGEWVLREVVFLWSTRQEVTPIFRETYHKNGWKNFVEMPIIRNAQKWRWQVTLALMTEESKAHLEQRMKARSIRLQAMAKLARQHASVVTLFYNRDEDVMLE